MRIHGRSGFRCGIGSGTRYQWCGTGAVRALLMIAAADQAKKCFWWFVASEWRRFFP